MQPDSRAAEHGIQRSIPQGKRAIFLEVWYWKLIVFQSLEALMYALKAIAEGVPHEESVPLQHVISSSFLQNLPKDTRLHLTALSMIGEYAEWLSHNPPSQLPALQFIMASFENKELAWAAASALFKVCDTCRSSLVSLATELVAVVANLGGGQLQEDEFIKVVKSVASVLQALPGPEATAQMLVRF